MANDIEKILRKWYDCKKEANELEKKMERYKLEIGKEMNRKNVEKIVEGDFVVSRRRNHRTYVTKESLPIDIWKKYCVKCNYDCYILKKK